MSIRIKPWDAERARARVRELENVPGAMLPVLHALQDEFGYIDKEAVPIIADVLNISEADVVGVISFYHDFRRTPPGKHILNLCRAEACQSMGCERVIRHVENRLGTKLGGTSQDGSFSLGAVFCLGNCALSPAVMLDGKLYGRVSTEVADFLIDSAQRQA
jgi:formate dehydrogenase subunit gamma